MNREIEWINTDEKICNDEIKKISKKLGFNLPEDYVEFIKNHHGGHPVPEAFDFKGHREAVLNWLFSYNEKNSPLYIVKVYCSPPALIAQPSQFIFPLLVNTNFQTIPIAFPVKY